MFVIASPSVMFPVLMPHPTEKEVTIGTELSGKRDVSQLTLIEN